MCVCVCLQVCMFSEIFCVSWQHDKPEKVWLIRERVFIAITA